MNRQLEPLVATELAAVAAALDNAEIGFLLGGSALLVLSGIDVPVRDLDIYTDHDDPKDVTAALAAWQCEVRAGGPEPWVSRWVVYADRGSGISIDLIGGLAVITDGGVARFAATSSKKAFVADRPIGLGPIAQWYHLYRVHNRAKADMIAATIGLEACGAVARELGIADWPV